ncbi:MAG: hypothetical protein PHR03_00975 [Desulfovibrionales bacterium]|nr:hypothetical protein [Desulfovibrionales bacterium]
MANDDLQKVQVRNFSVAFEQMCNFVAIIKTSDPNETIQKLILHCLAVLPDEKFYDARQIKGAVDVIFGLLIPEHQIEFNMDVLKDKKFLLRPAESNYVLPVEVSADIQKQINEADALEQRVKEKWLEELSMDYPDLASEDAWKSLKGYLARAYRRHGIQTTALLDPSIDIAPEYSESLSFLLSDSIKDYFPKEHYHKSKKAIAGFLSGVGRHLERTIYINQLADSAFNYFSVVVPQEIARRFREKLNPLILFLDTNFLFGILDLHVSHHVAVSNEFLTAIGKHKLPFKLRYHLATERELLSTIDYYGSVLRARQWSRSLSRAAASANALSGIELKFHQLNAATGIDVATFLKKYEHLDILLKEKNISVYRRDSERLNERSDLFHEYQEFLKAKKNEKSYETIAHDTKVLDTVRQLRTTANSSLDAGALILTCDYLFYRFDWEQSRQQNLRASTVLPNMFWQVLRPYIPSDVDFERSFAETFALPEFRTISSATAKACSKMITLMATYKDISEETATSLLSNDLLIDRLKEAHSDKDFQALVEAAIVSENAQLLEEKAFLQKELERAKAKREENERELEEERKQHELKMTKIERELKEKKDEANLKERKLAEEIARGEQTRREVADQVRGKDAIEKTAERETEKRKNAEEREHRYAVAAASAVSLLLIAGFEAFVHLVPWTWLRNHSNSYGLQGAFDILFALVTFGAFRPRWRKFCWGISGAFAAVLVILTILGGPTTK